MRLFWSGAALVALLLCSACGSDTPTALATATEASVSASAVAPTTASISNLTVDSPLSFTGNTFLATAPFHVSGSVKVTIDWSYSGTDEFSFWVENNSEFSSNPAYDRILVKDVKVSATSGQSDIDLITGDYVVDVETASASWQINLKIKP